MVKINKKAQVSIFLIIGLIILITGFFIFFIQRTEVEKPIEEIVEEQKPEFAGQTEIKNYVDVCLQDAVLQGLEIMRLQGGYIVVPQDAPSLKVKDKENKEVRLVDGSIRIVIDPNGQGNDVPYWLTKDSYNVPTIFQMETQLEKYVFLEVDRCIEDFKPFRDQGFDITYGDIIPDVLMENAITTRVVFPIRAKKGDIDISIDEFIYTVPIDMKLIVDRATDIVNFQDRTAFLEDHTKNLISLYSSVDEDKLPPYSQTITNFDCSSVSWSKSDVKNRLKDIFTQNTPLLKIKDTDFERIIDPDPLTQGVYDSFIHEVFDERNPSLKIDFSYRSEWEFLEYDIQPSSGDSLVPGRAVQAIPLVATICIFEYINKYSLDYPVLVEINDTNSASIDLNALAVHKNDGYNFQYALESYICGNQKRLCTGPPPTLDFSSVAEDLAIEGSQLLPVSLFCNEEQRISEDITIKAFDSDNNQALSDVNVFYYCGSYQNDCYIGKTDDNGILNTKFPLCINGILHTIKKDYANFENALTVYNEPPRVLRYSLDRLRDVNVVVKKVFVPTLVRNFHETGTLDIENAFFDFQFGENARIIGTGPSQIQSTFPDPENNKIRLSPGSYDLTVIFNGVIDIAATSVTDISFERQNGNFPFGQASFTWNIDKDEITDDVTFFALSNYDSSNIINADFSVLSDPILNFGGDMSAELLYKCERNATHCTDRCSFVSIDGTLFDNYQDQAFPSCMKTFDVTISKEQYGEAIRPKFR